MARMTSEQRRAKLREFEDVRQRRIALRAELEGLRRQLRVKSLVPGVEYGLGRHADIGLLRQRFCAVLAEHNAAAARCSRLAGELVP
jgi:hypothetical protein